MKARALALLGLALLGCRGIPLPDPVLKDEYGLTLQKEVRTVALYEKLETRAFVRMIRLTPKLLQAQAAEISRHRGEGPALAAERAAAWEREYEAQSYMAIVHTPEAAWNDWQLPNSVWSVVMADGETQTRPQHITRFDKPISPELRELYPYIDDFAVAYTLKFPKDAKGDVLVVAGVLGRMEFDFGAPPK